MFEKESEEYVINSCGYSVNNDFVVYKIKFGEKSWRLVVEPKEGLACTDWIKMYEGSEESCNKFVDWQNGAEFGYNKANGWHYVSKEGFPNKDDIYLIIRKDGLHLGDYCCGGDGDIDCQSWCDYPSEEEIQDDSVIAWKEIVLPELPKERNHDQD